MSTDYILPEKIVSAAGDINLNKFLKLFHLNARSLRTKQDEVSALFEACNVEFHVVMFTETWYTEDSDHYILPGYNHFYMNRIGSRGGGVSIQTTFTAFEIVSEYSQIPDNYESLCINCGKELFAVIYRPPTGCIAAFFRFIGGLFSYANDTGSRLVLGETLISMYRNIPVQRLILWPSWSAMGSATSPRYQHVSPAQRVHFLTCSSQIPQAIVTYLGS